VRYSLKPEPGYLWARVSDRRSTEDVVDFYTAVAAESDRTGLERILVESDETIPPPVSGLYKAAETLGGLFLRSKVAGVYLSKGVFDTTARFAENITYNWGIRSRMFHDRDEALKWLLSP
jgi:hypothetical protein